MFSNNEWKRLLTTLIDQTRKGQIEWDGDNDSEGYFRRIDAETVIAIRGVDGDARAPYELNVWREDKELQKSIKFGSITSRNFFEMREPDLVGELYEVIVRAINQVDSIFTNIMTRLQNPDVPDL